MTTIRSLAGVALALVPCAAALAQGSVTMYGILDNGYLSDKTQGKGTINAINPSLSVASRWGLRGAEDLGNGWKASFVLENGFTGDNGQQAFGRLFGRASYVGLSSRELGEIQLGRMANLGLLFTAGMMSPFGPSFQQAAVTTTAAYNTGDFGTTSRVNNAAYYFSPRWAGVQAGLGYSVQTADAEVAGGNRNNRMADLGLRYDGGRFKAAVSYQYVMPASTAGARGKPSNLQVGVNHDFGTFTLYGGYGRLNDPTVDPGANGATRFAATHDRDHAYQVGVKVPVGAGRVLLGYQWTTGSKIESYGLAYVYDLSRRTWLYVYANRTEFRLFSTAGATVGDAWRRQIAMGIAHRF